MPFFGIITERAFRKKSKAQEDIQMIQRCALIFSRKTRSVTFPLFGFFFQDSRIRVIVTGPWSRCMDRGLHYRLWSRETMFFSHGTMVSSHETMVSSHRTIGQNVVVLIMIKRFYHNRYPVRFVFL